MCQTVLYVLFIIFLIAAFFTHIQAAVTGRCANCHTMHNSQNGTEEDPNGPHPFLLSNDCLGCHSSDTSSTYYEMAPDGCLVPVVLYTGGSAPENYLAGGNFWWVKGGDDTKGHNVFLNEDDPFLGNAPGATVSCTNSCHVNLSRPYPGAGQNDDLGGKYGCEGCHTRVKHHASDHPNGESGLVTSAGQGWYRFLAAAHSPEAFGVKGFENGLWEAGHPDHSPGTATHNAYAGDSDPHSGLQSSDKGGISGFCNGCHAFFSSAYVNNPIWGQVYKDHWIRHPSDAVIPETGEYANAGGDSHLYDPLSPVAQETVDATPETTVTPGSDMVMCLSCHRPHGSPYPDMLRWDYSEQIAGGGGLSDDRGCFYCHTSKN